MSMKFTNNSDAVKLSMLNAKKESYDKLGPAIVKNIRSIMVEKGVYDTGKLYDSIEYAVDDDGLSVGSDVDYAPAQELGTSKQPAKPFISPGVLNNIPEYQSIIEGEVKNNFDK